MKKITQQIQKNMEEFDKDFNNNEVWWQECLAEMRIGDPDFKRLRGFLLQSQQDLLRAVVDMVEDRKKEIPNLCDEYSKKLDEKICFDDGYSEALSDLQELLTKKINEQIR